MAPKHVDTVFTTCVLIDASESKRVARFRTETAEAMKSRRSSILIVSRGIWFLSSACGASAPKHFCLVSGELESVAPHAVGDIVDAGGHLLLECRRV